MANRSPAALSATHREALEPWLIEFDRAWHEEALAAWAQKLSTLESGLRPVALVEMVKIDLERQWQRGRRVGLEAYLQAHPELGTAETVPVELIVAEFQVQRQFGLSVELGEWARRFPGRAEEIQRRIAEEEAMRSAAGLAVSDRDTSKAALTTHSHMPSRTIEALPEQFGRYRIVKKLGEGGMGAVYLAHDTQLDRQVALKVPRFSADESPQVLERFLREARSAAVLHHPNICPVHDAGQIDGVHYLTMAYIEGHSLSAFIRPDKPLPERHVAAVIRKLALALEEAHERGIIHRDLKPSNVMIDRRHEPVVMDFGLARRADGPQSHLTHSGALLGTPAYMSPEQVLGQPEQIGAQADVYSLGVILYELLTGHVPFEGPPAAVIGQVLTAEPPGPQERRADLDPRLAEICLKAMAKKREARYGSMKELATALGEYLQATKEAPAPRPGRETQASLMQVFGDVAATIARSAAREPARPALATRLQRVAPLARRYRKLLIAVAAGVFVPLLIWGVIVMLRTPDGTLVVEIDDPDATVEVLSEEGKVLVQGKGDKGKLVLSVDPGKRRLRVEKDGMVLFAQDFTLAPGGKETIRARLEPGGVSTAWGGHIRDASSGALRPARIVVDARCHLESCGKDSFPDLDVAWTYCLDKPLSDAILQGADILIVSLPSVAGMSYADEEIEAVERFVERGGGLLIGGLAWPAVGQKRYTEAGYPPNQLGTRFGLLMKAAYAKGPAEFADHPITRGLKAMSEAEGVKFSINSPLMLLSEEAKPLIWDTGGKVIYAASQRGKGRVCFVPSDQFRTDVLQKSPDHALLLRRMLQWLCHGEPKSGAANETPPAAMTPDRRAAEWVLSLGGWVRIAPQNREVSKLTDLPSEPFQIVHINLGNKPELTEDSLRHLEGLTALKGLEMAGNPQIGPEGAKHLASLKSLEYLELGGDRLTDAGLRHLTGLANLQQLLLWDNGLTDAGMESLKDLTSLNRLALGSSNVTGKGLALLQPLKSLQTLSLPSTGVTDQDVKLLAAFPKLRDLDLSNTSVTDAGLGQLATLRELETLHLDGLPITDAGLAVLARLNQEVLRDVELGSTKISDQGLRHLAGFKLRFLTLDATAVKGPGLDHLQPDRLNVLCLRRTPIDDPLLERHVARMSNLTTLNLDGTPVTDAGMQTIGKLEKLQGLTLIGTKITDAGLEKLKSLSNLTELLLQGTGVTAAGVAKLQAALPKCRIAWDGNATTETPDRRAAEWVLGLGGTVRVMSNPRVLRTTIADLPPGPLKLTWIHLWGNPQLTDDSLGRLKGLNDLQELSLHGNPKLGDGAVKYLQGLAGLRSLNLSDAQISDAGLAQLGSMTNLQSLCLRRTRISDAGLKHLAGLTGLRRLLISDNRITGAGLAHLTPLKNLEVLELQGARLVDDDLQLLAGFPKLCVLDLSETTITDAAMARLQSLPRLRRVRLQGLPITDAGLVELAKMKSPASLDLVLGKTRITDQGLTCLKGTNLHLLWMDDTVIDGPGLENIESSGIKVLSLRRTRIDDEDLERIGRIASLRRLWLDGTKVGDAGVERLVGLPNLQMLGLMRTRITDAGLDKLQAAKGLRLVRLFGTKVTPAGVRRLQQALPQCRICLEDVPEEESDWSSDAEDDSDPEIDSSIMLEPAAPR